MKHPKGWGDGELHGKGNGDGHGNGYSENELENFFNKEVKEYYGDERGYGPGNGPQKMDYSYNNCDYLIQYFY